MKYMIVIHEHETDFAAREDPAQMQAYWQSWQTYSSLVAAADPGFSGAALQPSSTSTTIRGEGSAKQVHDGPFADTKEQLGGFYIVDVDNLDIALDLAAKCPAVKNGAVEVRPQLEMNN